MSGRKRRRSDWVLEQPFFMLSDMAVGGSPGGPVFPDTEFPAETLVDHRRLYQPEPVA